jgi:hypothetical protein
MSTRWSNQISELCTRLKLGLGPPSQLPCPVAPAEHARHMHVCSLTRRDRIWGAATLSALKLTGLAPMAARRRRSRRSKLARKRAAALCGALAHGAGGTRQAGMNVQRKEHAGADHPGESTVWKLEAQPRV